MCTIPVYFAAKLFVLNKRFKIFFNYFFGPILFTWLIISIYHQVQEQKNIKGAFQLLLSAFTGAQNWKLVAVLVLTPINWGIEAKKWQVLLKTIQQMGYIRAYKAVLTGQALAVSSPNNIGEYVGRMIYADEGNRGRAITLNLVASLSQLIVTFLAGIIAWVYLAHAGIDLHQNLSKTFQFWMANMFWAVVLFTVLLLLLYSYLSAFANWMAKCPILKKYNYFFSNITHLHWQELTTVFNYSAIRFVIFLLQYVLMLQVCGVHAHALILAAITAIFFLVLAIVPTIALAEVGIRGILSLQLFGLVSNNMVGILFAATGIWFINRIIPALVGSILVLKIRLFKK
ncbi:MAG: flippase-like domain-containing protein [Bacteroidota bacterium]|jgi:hypothetical protein|nr:flippase-like domain-containing protein [Bacteroidota bacterium]